LMTIIFALLYGVAQLATRNSNVFRYWAGQWGRMLLLGFGVRVAVEWRTTLDPGQPYVFASNHQNLLDIPILARILPVPFGFVAKSELESVPFLGTALKMSPSVFVGVKDPRGSLESLKRAGKQIRDGRSVIIFPEGQRSYSSTLGPLKRSAFSLAAEARVPVVPITIVDAYRLMHEQKWLSRPGRVRVVVHPPLDLASQNRAELNRSMERFVDVISPDLSAGDLEGTPTEFGSER